ncbi:uncharacterized protein LOC130974535 [Arachis stenosperma]|uniref:uncharacterized protein LOC130974535 n=1 Tax=Arachis stenosperma TaxID=217475 RepID=UPI0025ABD609|nr:uncharacterized protein LOC130974535 [Arachis stenosperma]
MAIKVDISKAYDRVEWSFVWFIMKKLGFCSKWIEWMKACASTISYSVIVDGTPTDFFKSSRGLRQRDPLSPYLFLFCAEGLSYLLHKGEENNLFQGLRLNSRCPTIHHLLFADDSLLFCKATKYNYSNLSQILQLHGRLSGQQINFSKSAVFFSKNTPLPIRTELAASLEVPNIGTQDKYLGLPFIVHRSKKETFAFIKEKVAKKLSHWNKSFLSASGREVLIKAVGSAIPIYTLDCFKFSYTLLDELHRMMIQFWWGQKQNEKKMQWISWDTMTREKNFGGMEFKNLKAFNLAMLAK